MLLRGKSLGDLSSIVDMQVVAVDMPSVAGIAGNGWELYKVTVDSLKAATGYDSLADLPDAIESRGGEYRELRQGARGGPK